MTVPKGLDPDHPVSDVVSRRWSPYSFSGRDVSREDLLSLFEAARLAPSAFNEQPWRYMAACRSDDPEGFDLFLSLLMEGNREWARFAPVLAFGFASGLFDYNGRPNRTALHDLGLASGNLLAEATARGIRVHQMSGIRRKAIARELRLPERFEPVTGMAIGYAGENPDLPGEQAEKDLERRPRRPLSGTLFGTTWGEPFPGA